MLQQIAGDPISSRCTGFGLHNWPPQISQSEGFVVNFSVVWGEVNFALLLLLLYGLECSTVVGRGWVGSEWCCMFISNIFWISDGGTILPSYILLGRGGKYFCQIFPQCIPYRLDGSISWQLRDILCPWLTFLLVEESSSMQIWCCCLAVFFVRWWQVVSPFWKW